MVNARRSRVQPQLGDAVPALAEPVVEAVDQALRAQLVGAAGDPRPLHDPEREHAVAARVVQRRVATWQGHRVDDAAVRLEQGQADRVAGDEAGKVLEHVGAGQRPPLDRLGREEVTQRGLVRCGEQQVGHDASRMAWTSNLATRPGGSV